MTVGFFLFPCGRITSKSPFIAPKSIFYINLYFQNESSATLFTLRLWVNMYCCFLSYVLLIQLSFLPVPSVTLASTAQCKGKVYWCHSPAYGSHSLLHNDSITCDFFFFFNQFQDPDSWLPTTFGNLILSLLSFEIRRRVLRGGQRVFEAKLWSLSLYCPLSYHV